MNTTNNIATIENFFLKKEEENYSGYIINPELTLNFESDQESAQYLVALIRFWEKQTNFFCYDTKRKSEGEKIVYLPENDWEFQYKSPTYGCGSCRRGNEILERIFGDPHNFNRLPFVIFKGDRVYTFNFGLLKQFAEIGHANMLRLIREQAEERDRKACEEREEKQRKAREEKEARLDNFLKGTLINKALRELLLLSRKNFDGLTIVNPSIAIYYYHYEIPIEVFCGSERYRRIWEWKWNSNEKDEDYLHLGEICVFEKEDELDVKIEFLKYLQVYGENPVFIKKFTVTAVFIPDEPMPNGV